jgi:prevent-host-death family protein
MTRIMRRKILVVLSPNAAKTIGKEDRGRTMKSVTARDLQKKVKERVDLWQSERVIVTRHGKPAAVLVGLKEKFGRISFLKPHQLSGN